ncbi:MAG: pyridoxal phosphate-dependent aminotransferase [Oscillospiraceae bacterium]|nr:pyridoxal phosphate-dependent aminotransferase [Oscillospiraceae bacterium]
MKYNFDEIIERKNTNSLKYDFAAERGKPEGLIPLWVADMDFRTAPCVTETLIKSAKHSVFGYSETKKDGDYFKTVRKWFAEKFDFEIKPEWLVKVPGVVYAICNTIKAFTETGDGVLIQTPVYYPFKESIEANGRQTVTNPLMYIDGRYAIDFGDFENKITKNNVRLFILCSPHNPVGRVWSKEELTKMGDICLKHSVIVVSDEIHCDFVYNGYKHTVFGAISEQFLQNSIICTSPSKTFNLAGLQIANIFIADSNLRKKFKKETVKTGYSQLNAMGLVSCQAAYENGGEWVDELIKYIEKNYKYVKDFISVNLPKLRMSELEETYLIWLDLNAYDLSDPELERVIVDKAGVWVDEGAMFGSEGKGFIRINIACPLVVLIEAFNRLKKALNSINTNKNPNIMKG